jgi:hypothetical protein
MMTIMSLFSCLMKLFLYDNQWQSTTPCYNLPKTGAFTPITTYVGFQNQSPYTNIHLVSTNSEMEQLHLLNMLE